MSLLLPSALLALLALALPLLIHLQRRRATPPPRLFAALAFIDPQARPKQRVRLRDLLLLLLRLMLLAVLAFVLAQPLLHGRAGAPWVLLWPGLDVAQIGAVGEDAELRWLAPGFPRVDDFASPERDAPFSLLRQLAFERPLAQAIEVRVPRALDGWDGASLRLGRPIDWTVLPVELSSTPIEVRPLRVAVHVANGIEEEQRQGLAAVRAYFEGLGETSPLRMLDAAEVPTAEGVDALWVLVAAEAFEQPAQSAREKASDSGASNGGRGEGGAPVGQDPSYGVAAALGSLPLAWDPWLREGGRVLVTGLDAPVALEASTSEGRLGAAGDELSASVADALMGVSAEQRPDMGTDSGDAQGTDSNSSAAANANADAIAIAIAKLQAEAVAELDTRARTLWRGAHARVTAQSFEGAELRLLDCGLDARCLPELLEPDFPRVLMSWLAPVQAAASRIDASQIEPSAEGIAPQPLGTPLRDALVVVLLLLLLAERWLAATRRTA